MTQAICRPLQWDSNHFGFPIARLIPPAPSEGEILDAIQWAQREQIKCLYWLASAPGSSTMAAQQAGFSLIDVRMIFTIDLERPPQIAALPGALRIATSADLAPLVTLASTSHRSTRFYSDPMFPIDRSNALYAAWIEHSFYDPTQRLIVAGRPGQPVGYVACEIDEEGRTGTIGLIAVDNAHRGKGIGTRLVDGALAVFAEPPCDRARVVTQANNIAALRLYQRSGFCLADASFWFHRWF